MKPTQFGVVDRNTLFVAFEGRATEHTPLFKVRSGRRGSAGGEQLVAATLAVLLTRAGPLLASDAAVPITGRPTHTPAAAFIRSLPDRAGSGPVLL